MVDDFFFKQPTLPGVHSDEPHKLPSSIGPYKIESLLERGGTSFLYLALHPTTKEPVILKVLSPRFVSHPDMVKRFLNEAEIIALADHPNIVKLFGHGEWEGGVYIAMEYIQGISLRQYILQTPISLKRAIEIIIDISYALCHLHTHGIIHRDLKPENVIVTESGSIKVIDFGISQLLTEIPTAGAMTKQRLMGTPIYMSPEQRENPEAVSYPSDIYSLGIVAYELILGKLSHGQIHIGLMPKGLQKIFNKTLQFKPEDRYQDIVDFITEITAYLHSTHIQKERKVGDQLSELSENLSNAQKLLLPSAQPNWPGIELGLGSYQSFGFSTIYYDFLNVAPGKYGIIMGRASTKGAEGIIYTATVKGLVRALAQNALHPDVFVSLLNNQLVDDPRNTVFAMSYLLLDGQTGQISYISCGSGSLWHQPEGVETPTKITTDNLALGVEAKAPFISVPLTWKPGDRLFLLSSTGLIDAHAKDYDFGDKLFRKVLRENYQQSPQRIVDSFFRTIKVSAAKHLVENTIALIALQHG